jgi:hypothetical protein
MPLWARSPLGCPMKAKPGQVLISSPKDSTGRAFSAADCQCAAGYKAALCVVWVRRLQNARVASATGKQKANEGFLVLRVFEGVFGAGPGCQACPDGGGGLFGAGPGCQACPDGGGGSAKPRPERQDLLAGRSTHGCHGVTMACPCGQNGSTPRPTHNEETGATVFGNRALTGKPDEN